MEDIFKYLAVVFRWANQKWSAWVSTSHIERMNLNLRTFVRRMTWLSNGFSKKWSNHEAAIALYFFHYNYCRKHGTLKATPAQASGVEKHRWTVREMIERTAGF